MDLAFTPEEQAFREEIRGWVRDNLPADIAHKVHNALRLSRDDMQRWAKILGKKGWLGWNWPKQFGGPGWNAVQRHLFEEECARAGAPRVVPFGPVMVAPVIMAFGNKAQQERLQALESEDQDLAGKIADWRARHPELDDGGLEDLLRVDDAQVAELRQRLQLNEKTIEQALERSAE